MNRRRRLLMSGLKVNVEELEFSYTGTWTDSLIEMSGATYRVLQLKSDGTLTIDLRMVGVVPFDVWCVRKGETGSKGSDNLWTDGTTRYHNGCPNPSGEASMLTYYASDGANGDNGGWAIKSNIISYASVIPASVGITAYLGDLIRVTGTARPGAQWFSLPSSNNGAGGAGGYGANGYRCVDCKGYWGNDASPGSPGTPGIIVIRIPLG